MLAMTYKRADDMCYLPKHPDVLHLRRQMRSSAVKLVPTRPPRNV